MSRHFLRDLHGLIEISRTYLIFVICLICAIRVHNVIRSFPTRRVTR